jgi:hypothetical protein
MHCETQDDTVYATVTRGDTFSLSVELTDSAGSPVNASGWAWLCHMLQDGHDDDPVLVEVNTTDAAIGLLVLTIADDVTAEMPTADWSWDLQATDELGETRTLVTGKLRVKADVSQAVG